MDPRNNDIRERRVSTSGMRQGRSMTGNNERPVRRNIDNNGARPAGSASANRPAGRPDRDNIRRPAGGDSSEHYSEGVRRPSRRTGMSQDRAVRTSDGMTGRNMSGDRRVRKAPGESGRPSKNMSGVNERPVRRTYDSSHGTSGIAKAGNGSRLSDKNTASSKTQRKNNSGVGYLDKYNNKSVRAQRKESDEPISREEWIARKKRNNMIKQYSIIAGLALIVILVLILLVKLLSNVFGGNDGIIKKAGKLEVTKKLISVDNNTRPGQKLEKVKKIIVHNTGESGATATKMWDYYESLGRAGDVSESMHFVIDTDGSIIQCIPTNEIAFHALSENHEALGIQYCYSSDNGVMSDKTKDSMVELLAALCKEYKLTTADIVLHADVTGIACPKYYVDNNEEWQNVLKEVSAKLK